MFLWPGLASPPISGEGAAGAGAGLIPSQGWGCSSPGALSSALTRLREDFPRHLAHHHHQAEREETPEGSMELWAQAGNHSPSVGSVPASLSLLRGVRATQGSGGVTGREEWLCLEQAEGPCPPICKWNISTCHSPEAASSQEPNGQGCLRNEINIQARGSFHTPSWRDITNQSLHSRGSGHSLGTLCVLGHADQPIRISQQALR